MKHSTSHEAEAASYERLSDPSSTTGGDPTALPRNPFVYIWLGTGVVLNITGLASVVGDVVKWIQFFAELWATYQSWVRDPLLQTLMLFWPNWFPPIPRFVADAFVIWSGLWIAITIYHYQVARSLKLAEVFKAKQNEVSESLLHGRRLPVVLVEIIALMRAMIEVVYCYFTLPILYIYYSVFDRAPLQMPISDANARLEKLSGDLDRISSLMDEHFNIKDATLEKVDYFMQRLQTIALSKEIRQAFADRIAHGDDDVTESILLQEKMVLQRLRTARKEVSERKLALEKAIDTQYLVLAARQVLTYYGCIVACFIGVLFVNYTASHLGAS
jgi:hypothetical protein